MNTLGLLVCVSVLLCRGEKNEDIEDGSDVMVEMLGWEMEWPLMDSSLAQDTSLAAQMFYLRIALSFLLGQLKVRWKG